MSVFKKYRATTISAILIAIALVTAGAMKVEGKIFNRGYGNSGRAAKARPNAYAINGSATGGIGKTTRLRGQAWRDKNVNITSDWNSDGKDTVGRRNRNRTFANQLQGQRTLRNGNRKSFILPYIEQDNLYR